METENRFKLYLLAIEGWRKVPVDRKKIVADAIIKADKVEAVRQLQKVVKKVMSQMGDNVAAGLKDAIEPVLQEVVQPLAQRLMASVQGFFDKTKQETPIMPQDCRFVQQSDGSTRFLIEQRPQVRQIAVSETIANNENNPKRSYRLSFPYTVFVVGFSGKEYRGIQMGFRNKPIHSLDDMVGLPALSNTDSSLGVCMGPDFNNNMMRKLQNMSYSEAVEQVLNDFWSSRWSWESTDAISRVRQCCRQVESFAKWEMLTTEDPLMALKVKWPEARQVKDMIQPSGANYGNLNATLQKMMQEVCDAIIRESVKYMIDSGSKDMTYADDQVVAGFATSLRELAENISVNIVNECEQLVAQQRQEDLRQFEEYERKYKRHERSYDEPWVDPSAYRRWKERTER
jgi:hypothetical protein